MRHSNSILFIVCLLASFSLSSVAMAHPGHEPVSGFFAGLVHPLSGMDHLLAIVASGLLAWRTSNVRAFWVMPALFVALMVGGGVLAAIGVGLPFVEVGILASLVVLGAGVAMMRNVSVIPAAILVAIFAVCHGYAHVAESTGALATYMVGFAVSTLLLHGVAIGASQALRSQQVVRWVGATIACSAMFFIV